ncbi:hypothetical protein EVAR_50778_1 [Eumeta japonica]|uniref:Uncharacterized protein n=1 Tax=Eumeta variegata TaxID=151549 RepID=A0A4C1WWC0_EUMVA|nr:hypothetical protein EVAR_50778_1 [Eumeta japonica]
MPVELEFDFKEKCSAMEIFSQKDIDELHSWIQNLDKSKYVPKDLSNKQLLLFYNACYQDLNKTKTCIEKYYDIRHNAPELFDNRIISSADLKPSVEALTDNDWTKSEIGVDRSNERYHSDNPEDTEICVKSGAGYEKPITKLAFAIESDTGVGLQMRQKSE